MTIGRCGVALAAAAIGLATGGPGAWAGPLEDGIAAYEARNFEAAGGILRPLAEGGDPVAQIYVGFAYSEGQGVAEDDAEAVRWFTLSAEQGNLYAAHRLGVHYSRGDGVAEDDVEGVRWFRLAAEGGVAEAQLSMAVHYYGGEGVPGSLEEAFAWAAISAGQGNYQAARFQTRLEEDLTDEMLRRAAELAQTYWKQFVVPFLNQAN